MSYRYLTTVMERIKARFSADDVAKLEQMLDIISEELMNEVSLPEPAPQGQAT